MNENERFETQIAALQAKTSRLLGYCMTLEMAVVLLLKLSPGRDALYELLSLPASDPMAQDNPDAERTKFAAQVLRRLQTQTARMPSAP